VATMANNGIRYFFEGAVLGTTVDGNNYLFGAYSAYNSARSCNVSFNPTATVKFGVLAGGNTVRLFDFGAIPAIGEKFSLEITCSVTKLENSIALYNGINIPRVDGGISREIGSSTPPNILLFSASYYENSSTNGKFWGRCYGFEMHSANSVPLRQFVPCYRKADQVVGLYDIVESTFYENRGMGSFLAGKDI